MLDDDFVDFEGHALSDLSSKESVDQGRYSLLKYLDVVTATDPQYYEVQLQDARLPRERCIGAHDHTFGIANWAKRDDLHNLTYIVHYTSRFFTP